MRDMDTARSIVMTALDPVMEIVGDVIVPIGEFTAALEQAVTDVADLLDPDEVFEFEVM